jgi:hypothetical protein
MKRHVALWIAVALLGLNAVLLAAQPGLALPRVLANYFFGPGMVRAEVVMQDRGQIHLYRIDRGRIRSLGPDSIVLRERDGRIETVAIAPDAEIVGVPRRGRGGRQTLHGLRRGMFVETVRDGDAPAERVRVLPR